MNMPNILFLERKTSLLLLLLRIVNNSVNKLFTQCAQNSRLSLRVLGGGGVSQRLRSTLSWT